LILSIYIACGPKGLTAAAPRRRWAADIHSDNGASGGAGRPSGSAIRDRNKDHPPVSKHPDNPLIYNNFKSSARRPCDSPNYRHVIPPVFTLSRAGDWPVAAFRL